MKNPQIVPAPGPRRRALCIGIDSYTRAPLRGAVSDAERWAEVLEGRGFAIELLRNGDATRERVLEGLWSHVIDARPGDRVAIAFAGHGTRDSGRSDDTAIVCADAEHGGIVLDDEIGEVMREIRPGVSVTLFFDCCHSGTMSRSGAIGRGFRGPPIRVRHLASDPHIREAFARLREERGGGSPRRRGRGMRRFGRALGAALFMREVCFAACGEHEIAFEVGGAGVFTAAATTLLQEDSGVGWSNQGFLVALEGRMREIIAQRPRLSCAPWRRREGVLGWDVVGRVA